MVKKVKKINEDEETEEIIDDFEGDYSDNDDEEESPKQEVIDDDDDEESGSSEICIDDDDENIDLIIEIDDDDLDLLLEVDVIDTNSELSETGEVEPDEIVLSKHKMEGKHSLKYDSIFKGKKEDPLDECELEGYGMYHKDTIEVDKSSQYYFESIDNESYIRSKLVKERVYAVLGEFTSINFLNNRRKPSRSDFNNYYLLLKTHLKEESFTNVELFNELAVYFSDNLFNMFKLLDNKWRNMMICELQDHIGKNKNSKEISNRNIYEGTEIEFNWIDEFNNNETISITGVVIDADYENSLFKVDSYENIYMVEIPMITKILNNTKFKYNLNRLNNIDFF